VNETMNAIDPRFESWLSQETGIDARSLGVNALERAVLERVRVHAANTSGKPGTPTGHANPDTHENTDAAAIETYWQHLNASPDERLALIEALVVPETWFFRDREAFVTLARLANEKLARDAARVLRVLSVPCSSGEEPYSAAMALLDAGIGADRFVIDAMDISARVIDLAQQAVYGRNSFRGGELEFRERHFSAQDHGWLLNERVRASVRFSQANLFDAPLDGGTRYDFIFCRNVLIYFRRDAQDRAIHLLDARLADGGMIFVGPAETGLMMRHTLSSARIPLAFAFQRTPAEETRAVGSQEKAAEGVSSAAWASKPSHALGGQTAALHGVYGTARAAATPSFAPGFDMQNTPAPLIGAFGSTLSGNRTANATTTRTATTQAPAPRTDKATHAAAHATPTATATLAQARRLADAAQFDEAAHEAQTFLNLHGPDPEAFYLLGLIADARGRSADASDYYRKTLYLDPAHYEALTHLAALLDMTGDSAGAQQLMRRAERAAAKMPAAADTPLTPLRGAHDPRRH
jgi:chemotaxis protein methyltransferase WspC